MDNGETVASVRKMVARALEGLPLIWWLLWVWEKLGLTSMTFLLRYPVLSLLFGRFLLRQSYCLGCGQPEEKGGLENFVSCSTPGCKGEYCIPEGLLVLAQDEPPWFFLYGIFLYLYGSVPFNYYAPSHLHIAFV